MTGFPSPLPWLAYNGVEVSNAARTMRYIQTQNPSASGIWQMPDVFPCGILYREIGGSGFLAPDTDPAPWYHNDFPESADFLGFVIGDIWGLDSLVTRAVTPRLGGIEGGTLGPEHMGPRELTVTGVLIGSSLAGIDYGMRWLTHFLSTTSCANCRTAPLIVRVACPPENQSDEDLGRYTIYDVGLSAGPHFLDELSGSPSTVVPPSLCDIREVEFVLTAENPYLYQEPVVCLPSVQLGGSHPCT